MPLSKNERRAFIAAAATTAAGFAYLALRLRNLSHKMDDHWVDAHWRSVHETRHLQAWTWLISTLDIDAPLPPMRGWAISPQFAQYYVQLLREHHPRHVLELGGGTSTILSGLTLEAAGVEAAVVAVEALEQFAQATRDQLTRHNISNASVVHAPMTRTKIGRQKWLWYDTEPLAGDAPIHFLLVDGPAQFRQKQALMRYPALPLLWERLAPGAHILIDDADRQDERRIVARWLHEFEGLSVVEERFDIEGGAVLLRKSG